MQGRLITVGLDSQGCYIFVCQHRLFYHVCLRLVFML